MRRDRRLRWVRWVGGAGIALCLGCASKQVRLPCGHVPPATTSADVQTSGELTAEPSKPEPRLAAAPPAPGGKKPFDLPPGLPGADASPLKLPRLTRDMPVAEREKALREVYPAVTPVAAAEAPAGAKLALVDLQQMALAASPAVRRARADVDAAYGAVIQAGLRPNPTVGWEADQWKPGTGPDNNNGQQGAFIDQLIKTAGKLSLARQVAGFDYLNAQVALRRAEVDVINQVRALYFSMLVARRGVEVNRALVTLADEVYNLQIKQLSAGEAAPYEPLQMYAQAVQARNNLVQAEVTYRTAWKQLTTLLGQPELSQASVAGRADAPPPLFDPAVAEAIMLEGHTDLLTSRNTILQSQANLTLQRRTRIPDLQTRTVVQQDNAVHSPQVGLQVGVALPVFDRNQGNILQAQAKIGRAIEDLKATEIDLRNRLADALARYQINRVLVENYRDRVLPNLSQAYRAQIRTYDVLPEKVSFTDKVQAQQNLAAALQNYLSALDAMWKAAVDVAALVQTDDIYSPPTKLP